MTYRADGYIELHGHEEITTEDGETIACTATGTAQWLREKRSLRVFENLFFSTGSPRHPWLNSIQAVCHGEASASPEGLSIEVREE